jgi:hypothetical protein
MESETFRSRVVNLIARSRKALRLYSNVGKFQSNSLSELTEKQTSAWKQVTADLLKELTVMLEHCRTHRELVDAIFRLRDRFNIFWRDAEAELQPKQKELLSASQSGDFVRACVISSELVLLKARMQAGHAAHHELADVLTKSRVSPSTITLSDEDIFDESEEREGGIRVNDSKQAVAQRAGAHNTRGIFSTREVSSRGMSAKVIPIRKIL